MINYQLPISGNESCIYNTLILLYQFVSWIEQG
jgi:hypothetical protein